MDNVNWTQVLAYSAAAVISIWGLTQWVIKYAVPKIIDKWSMRFESQIKMKEMQVASDLGEQAVAHQLGTEATIHAIDEATSANDFIRKSHDKLSNGLTAKIEQTLKNQEELDDKLEQIKQSLQGLNVEMSKIKMIIKGEVTHKRSLADILVNMEKRLGGITDVLEHRD